MAVTFLKESGTVCIPTADLARYAYPKESPDRLTRQYGFVRDDIYTGFDSEDDLPGVSRHVPLESTAAVDGLPVVVSGKADIVAFDGLSHTVEEIIPKNYLPYGASPFDDPAAFARAVCHAHMLAEERRLPLVRVRITLVKKSTDDRISWFAPFSKEALRSFFLALVNRAGPFLKLIPERAVVMMEEIINCPFPFPNIREGQRDFVLEAFRTIKSGGKLFVSAPTGIGKTMASLYPAVKSLSTGAAEKIFYLTSKTVTGLAALDAVRTLNRSIPHLRAVMISAKELQCPFRKKKAEDPVGTACTFCVNTHELHGEDGSFLSYPERQNNALLSLLYSDDRVYTTERLKKTAEDFSVCPYELALDLSGCCDVVVCDYNYAYDDSVRFQRYFKNGETLHSKYVFLIDEAHNLPDRVRDMYSASVSTDLIDELLGICRGGESEIPTLYAALIRAREYLDMVQLLCREGESVRQEDGREVVTGYYKNNSLDEDFVSVFTALSTALNKEVSGFGEYAAEYAPYRNHFRKIAFVCSFFDERFCFFAEKAGDKVTIDLLCLDPSEIIAAMNRAAKAVIQFSATLSPMEYYKTVSGSPRGTELDLPSPYDRENLCLIAYDSISTRYGDRKDSAFETASVIAEAISAKEGNYIVYFSSYAHMKTVFHHFARMMPEVTLVMQKSGMSFRERERFLSVFGDSRYGNIVGFCVLGGMFSEGIDLSGEKLIGAIIVGMGIPGLSAARNIMQEYYENKTEKGREFAYVYPGMNKVLQAAGRVIRSEEDRGMVLLIDDRYSEPEIKLLFPPHWRHMRCTGDPASMRYILDEFWEKGER